MSASVKESRIISVSSKRQITLPLSYFNSLAIGNEVECVLEDSCIVIKPVVKEDANQFAELILADLIKEGYEGESLLCEFKLRTYQIKQAAQSLLDEASEIARGDKASATLEDLFG